MKKLLFFLMLFICSNIIAKENTPIGDKQEVVETSMTKDAMWINLKKWVSSQFNSYEHVVDLEDRDSGVLIIKWNFTFIPKSSAYIKMKASSTIKVDIKENKYRYTISESIVQVMDNIGNTSNMSYSELEQATNDLKFIEAFCINKNNKSTEWRIDCKFLEITNHYKDILDSTPKYKNEKKKKLSKDWEKADRKYRILESAISGYESISLSMIQSLKKSMIDKDDF